MPNHYIPKSSLRALLSLFSFICSLTVSNAVAQDLDEAAVQEQSDQIIQLQQQRQNAEQKAIEDTRQHVTIDSNFIEQAQNLPDSQCFQIDLIDIVGIKALSRSKVEKLMAPYQAQCLSLADINELLQLITHTYFEKGYVTTRAYLPEQSLLSGILKIQVIEGRVEQIDKTQAKGITLFNSFPRLQNHSLNLRDIEQGIEQLNRLGRNRISMELIPGSQAGNTTVQLANDKSRSWQTNIRIDNSGQPSTGEYLVKGYLSYDDLAWLNDFFYVSYQVDTEDKEGADSRSIALHWDVPYGYWLFSADTNWFNYNSRVPGEVETFDTSGDSQQQTLKLSRILFRNKTAKTELISSLTRKNNNNFIEGVKLDTSSRTLTVAQLQLRHQLFLPAEQSLQGSLGYKQGMDWFGAAHRQSEDAPDPQYGALIANLDYSKGYQWLKRRWSYSSSLSAQYSDEELFGSEQFSIGSLYSVRGFKGEGLSANSGLYWRNDLSMVWPVKSGLLGVRSIKPSLGLDTGAVFDGTDYQDMLGGMAVGLSLGNRYLSTDVTYTRALLRPERFSDSHQQIHFSLTFKL